jgi:hypothetical protein
MSLVFDIFYTMLSTAAYLLSILSRVFIHSITLSGDIGGGGCTVSLVAP